jgi:hypothetical protein
MYARGVIIPKEAISVSRDETGRNTLMIGSVLGNAEISGSGIGMFGFIIFLFAR